MKRAVWAIVCCTVLLASSGGAYADSAFDRDMANRYSQAPASINPGKEKKILQNDSQVVTIRLRFAQPFAGPFA